MRVEEASGTDVHVADLLALYHLDALDRRSGERVGEHLESCGECRAAATEVCASLAALALLTDDGDRLLDAYGALGAARPPAFPARFAPQELPDEPDTLLRRAAEASESRRFRFRRRGRSTEATGTGAREDGGGRATQASQSPVAPAQPQPRLSARPPAEPPPPVAPALAPGASTLPKRTPQMPAAAFGVLPEGAARPASHGEVRRPAVARQAGPPPQQVRPLKSVKPVETPTVEPAEVAKPARPATPVATSFAPARSTSAPPNRPDAAPVTRAGAPGPGNESRRPERQQRSRRTLTLVRLTGLLLVAAAVAGISAKALINPPTTGSAPGIVLTAVASAADRKTGAELSVLLTAQDGGVAVRATLSGLDKGVGYRLYGNTFDGRQRPVVNWTGRDGVQEVSGELPVSIADISHFEVTRGTRVIVTAYLPAR